MANTVHPEYFLVAVFGPDAWIVSRLVLQFGTAPAAAYAGTKTQKSLAEAELAQHKSQDQTASNVAIASKGRTNN